MCYACVTGFLVWELFVPFPLPLFVFPEYCMTLCFQNWSSSIDSFTLLLLSSQIVLHVKPFPTVFNLIPSNSITITPLLEIRFCPLSVSIALGALSTHWTLMHKVGNSTLTLIKGDLFWVPGIGRGLKKPLGNFAAPKLLVKAVKLERSEDYLGLAKGSL